MGRSSHKPADPQSCLVLVKHGNQQESFVFEEQISSQKRNWQEEKNSAGKEAADEQGGFMKLNFNAT